jgi:hypothetical protein
MSKLTFRVARPFVALVLAGLPFAIRVWAGDSGSPAPPAAQANMAPTIPNELVTVNRFGVYPTEITRPKGRFALVVMNSRGTRQESFAIVRLKNGVGPNAAAAPDGPPLATLSTTAARPHDLSVLNLPPGIYLVVFGKDSNFSVKLTIQ